MENFVFCNEEEIIEYLGLFGKGRDSHDTELSEAVRLKSFYETHLKRIHLIGIPISQEGIIQLHFGIISKNETIKKFRKEDTEVDFIIIDAEDSRSTPRDSFRGDVFQMKRLTDRQFDKALIPSIISALEKILNKGYERSTYLSLYMPINLKSETNTPDWEAVTNFLSKRQIPFVRILLGPIKNECGEELFIEVFPNLRFLPSSKDCSY